MCQPGYVSATLPRPKFPVGGGWGRLGEVGEVGLVLPACLCSVRPGGREITAPARSQLE